MSNHRHTAIEDMRQQLQGTKQIPRSGASTYWWIWGKTMLGRNYIDGAYNTEDEAWQEAYQVTDIDLARTKIVPLRTIDRRAATNAIKKMDLSETRSVESSLARARHKL